MGLTWKAKGKRPNLTGDDRLSSSSDDEDSGDEVWAGMGSLTKGQSAYPKDDHNNNTARLHMGDPDPDQGSQGIDALDQVADLTEFVTDIQAPANAGDSKEEKLTFLAVLSEETLYQARVQWLTDNLVLYYPLL